MSSVGKRNNLVSFFADKIKTRPTRKRRPPLSTTQNNITQSQTEPTKLIVEETAEASQPSINEIAEEEIKPSTDSACCPAIVQYSQISSEILSTLDSSNMKLTSVEAQISKLNSVVDENSQKMRDIDVKLEQLNDQLSNIFEVLTLLLTPNGNKKKIGMPILDSESPNVFKHQVSRSPRKNSTVTSMQRTS